jgi:hypothetical protein
MATASFQKLPQAYKFMIGSVPETGEAEVTVEAQFNPKELQIDSPIKWTEHEVIGAQSVATKPMEFTGMGAETVKVELVFDAFEDDTDYVVESIAKLKQLASVRNPHSSKSNGTKQRPSFCVATWGTQAPFRCVIESISVKYTMFSYDGTPVRATVVISLKSGCRTVDDAYANDFERASIRKLADKRKNLLDARSVHQVELQKQRDEEQLRLKRLAEREQRKRDFQLE